MSDEITYLNFEISVQKAGENEYIVRAKSGDGEAETRFVSPFNKDKQAVIDLTLTKAAMRASARVRSSSAPEVRKMKEMGAVLFEHAISGPVREFYYKCQGQADQQHIGMRWRLSLDPSIGNLPWEFLFLQDDFLALNPRSPVVRYLKGAARFAPLKTERPLRMLVVIATPDNETPLETSVEKAQITKALQPLTEKGLLNVTYIEGPDTWDRLCDALLRNDTHILHFIGHGAFDEANGEGVLVMEDSDRAAVRIDSERLRVLVQGKSRLRLVVLNSCLGTAGSDSQPFSSMAAGLVRSGIPAVIAMQFEISDPAAREIAETFYTSLALNLPVDAALTEARRAIYLKNKDSLEWATPILYMQVPDGQLFQLPNHEGEDLAPITGPLPEEPETIEAIAALVKADTNAAIPLGRKSIRIGRGADNDVDLDEAAVSRKHAALVRSKDTYALENFGRTGTLLNGKPVTRRTTLKHNDVIRVGTADFKFRLLANVAKEVIGTTDPKASRRTVTEPERKKTAALETNAARHYEDGEKFMARGNWAEAITAFERAVLFVADYRDTKQKLSVCEDRFKVFSLYNQAKHQCAAKNYDKALSALDQATELDPDLSDTNNIRELAECGQKYREAISELHKGNRERGIDLLREVIGLQPGFEDAEARLANLAKVTRFDEPPPTPAPPPQTGAFFDKGKEIWNQWWGPSTPPPSPGALVPSTPRPPNQPATTSGFAWRTYALAGLDLKQLADEIHQYLGTHQYERQLIQQDEAWMVQGRKSSWLRSVAGMAQAATVVIEPTDNGLKVSIGGAKWVDKGAALATGLFLGVTWVTGAVGYVQQQQLIDDLWRVVETAIKRNGGGPPVAFG